MTCSRHLNLTDFEVGASCSIALQGKAKTGYPQEFFRLPFLRCLVFTVEQQDGSYPQASGIEKTTAADRLLYLGYLFFIWIDPYFYCPVYLSHPDSLYTDGLFQQVLYFKDFFCSL